MGTLIFASPTGNTATSVRAAASYVRLARADPHIRARSASASCSEPLRGSCVASDVPVWPDRYGPGGRAFDRRGRASAAPTI